MEGEGNSIVQPQPPAHPAPEHATIGEEEPYGGTQPGAQERQPVPQLEPLQGPKPASGGPIIKIDVGKQQTAAQAKQNQKAGVGGGGKKIIILALVIIVAGVVYFFARPSTSPNRLITLLTSNKSTQLQVVADYMMQQTAMANELNTSYSGVATVIVYGTSSSSTSASIPFGLVYEKYANNSRYTVMAQDVPFLGNLSIVILKESGISRYVCTESSTQGGASGFQCVTASGNTMNSTSFGEFSDVQLGPYLRGIDIGYGGQRVYRGTPCSFVSGNGTVAGNFTDFGVQMNQPFDYALSMCLSNDNYLPLNLSFRTSPISRGTSSPGISIVMNQTSISKNTSFTGVTSLPGPIVNSTAPGLQIINSTSHLSNTSTSIGQGHTVANYSVCTASKNFFCSSPVLTSYGNMSFGFSQSTGATLYNLQMACVLGANGGQRVFYGINGTSGGVGSANTYGTELNSGVLLLVSQLRCSGIKVGTYSYNGELFINYTKAPGRPGSTNAVKWVTSEIGTIYIANVFNATGPKQPATNSTTGAGENGTKTTTQTTTSIATTTINETGAPTGFLVSCALSTNYGPLACTKPAFNTNGNLSFSFREQFDKSYGNGGSYIYNIKLGCLLLDKPFAASMLQQNGPLNTSYYALPANGTISPTILLGASLKDDNNMNVTNLPCYGPWLGSLHPGAEISGQISIAFTGQSGAPNQGNPIEYEGLAGLNMTAT